MRFTEGGVSCEYERYDGDGKTATVVFLHGWGGGIASFSGAYGAVCGLGIPAVNFAFPKSVPSDWSIYDYAEYVARFLRGQDIVKPIIVGHSFGGRIGIILAAQGLCGKLVLVDSAGMKPKFSLRKKLRIARYKRSVKRGKPLDGLGSVDYNNLEPEMRGVFVRIVNEHLERLLPYISCKTLIVWGKSDKDTPPYMARRLRRGIKDSALVELFGGHYAYVDSHYGFIEQLKSFVLE